MRSVDPADGGHDAGGEVGAPMTAPCLADIALALLAGPQPDVAAEPAEAVWLGRAARELSRFAGQQGLDHNNPEGLASGALTFWLSHPPDQDIELHALARHAGLEMVEALAIALARVSEFEPMAARALIWLQQPVGEARPTVGLVNTLSQRLGEHEGLLKLAEGNASRIGMLQLLPEDRLLCERWLKVPLPILLALEGREGRWDGVSPGGRELPPLSASVCAEAQRYAAGLHGDASRTLLIRSAQSAEARAAAQQVAYALEQKVAFIEGDPPPGVGAWLWLRGRIPVLCWPLTPGERRTLPQLPGYAGPILVATGLEGNVEAAAAVAQWRVPVPPAEERAVLWHAALGDGDWIDEMALSHRHAAARIVELGQAARSAALSEGADAVGPQHVARVARCGTGADLGALAELLSDDIVDDALVLSAALRSALDGLVARCRVRDALADELGVSARSRYKPGVRALFTGASGTGKTLAAGWIATRLQLPLYRVDLASVTSKYIGETEKNLAELFARAEHAEVVLLFDEADALFGKRTDVKDANDRFANQQTNYLLQRIESYEGITLLTSNSRARFDSAFTRRLDAIIEFPAPGPGERRALWMAHLGDKHSLDAAALNRLAAGCELAGGHIRNAVLGAAALAYQRGDVLSEADVISALAAEYRKLGKQIPAALRRPEG